METNLVYSERTAGKGSNEVISMLHMYALRHNVCGENKAWTIYADNCGGQNKNSDVLRFLVLLVASGKLRSACLNFFVKGHTKNNCDRGFGCIKRAYVRRDLYTVEQVVDMIQNSSTGNEAVNLELQPGEFKDWKSMLEEIYHGVKGIQKFQLFSIDQSVVQCRKRPSPAAFAQDFRKDKDVPDFAALMTNFYSSAPPSVNAEKVAELHKKLLRFIPEEHRGDPLFR
ncbi:hypothetical protein P43SY_004331 [Pythium insidiosum]|uniref:DUF7869 domain-containing protein n=1 Tax=Pythium insidiosum TaxID=114742 RepID=A0AAD5LX47_PYTIN|nr:hypothetical protein P43SY_004331 [Pythium insidiosum]